ncbi:MAG TPA: tyrosine-protein phosphatase [Bryobacteraceae bacterium]|nr:tyrosine-protein phosphatase [Bryobacteraceae bacterium]
MKFKHFFLGWRTPAFFIAIGLPAAALAASQPEGVGNFQKVDDHVYRGAQPTEQGFKNLAQLGIKTIVDLREPGDRTRIEEKMVRAAGMEYVSVPMYGMETPSNDKVVKVLALLEDTTTGPVFVHCKRGADRTGAVIACYRMEHDRWKNAQALTEAKSLGMSFFERAIQRYVREFKPRTLDASSPRTIDAAVATPGSVTTASSGASAPVSQTP